MNLIAGIVFTFAGSLMIYNAWNAYKTNTIIPATYSKSGWMWWQQSLAIGGVFLCLGLWALIDWTVSKRRARSEYDKNDMSNKAL